MTESKKARMVMQNKLCGENTSFHPVKKRKETTRKTKLRKAGKGL